MSNPQMPGVGVMTDTLEFVKNLWGSMSVPGMSLPGMVVPTMSVQDLDKKINDLKAVESWLNLNVSMLHGSIQALEVQRATISTLQSMGSAMAAALKQPEGKDPASLFASVPYASAFFAGTQAAPVQKPDGSPAPAAQPAPAAATAAKPTATAGDFAGQAGSPALWWNILQDQFKQVVGTAIGGDGSAKSATAAGSKTVVAPSAAATPTGKPAKPTAGNGKPAAKPAIKPAPGGAAARAKTAALPAAGNTGAAKPSTNGKT